MPIYPYDPLEDMLSSLSEPFDDINGNGIKENDSLYNNSSFSLKEFSDANEIKITIGKKKIGIIKIN